MAAGGFLRRFLFFNEIIRVKKGKKPADLYRSAGRDLFIIILTHPPQDNAADNGCFHDNT